MLPGSDPLPPPPQWSQNARPALRLHSWWCRAAPPWSSHRTRPHPRRCHHHHRHRSRLTYHQWSKNHYHQHPPKPESYFILCHFSTTYPSGQLIGEHSGLHAKGLGRLLYVDCARSHWFQNLLRSRVAPKNVTQYILHRTKIKYWIHHRVVFRCGLPVTFQACLR